MFTKFFGIFIFLILLRSFASAQLSDTIAYSLQQKPKFFFTLSTFNTNIDGQFANISIIKMGLGFNQRIRFGIGYSILASNSVTKKIHISENNLEYDTDGNLHLGYVSLSAEYFFYNDYPWQFTFTPFNIGIGSARYQYVNRPDRLKAFTDTKTIILYQPEISAQYSILRWLGVGITTGYRLSVLKTPAETKLNSFTYALDLRLYLDEIYKMIFDKEEEK